MTTRRFRTTALALATGAALAATAACGNGEDTDPAATSSPAVTPDSATTEAPATTEDSTADAPTGEATGGEMETGPGSGGGDIPAEHHGVLAAIELAVAEHDGAPAFEVDDGDGDIWEVHVAVGDDDIEVHVAGDGSQVISSEREADLDSDDRAGLEAAGDFTLAEAVRAAIAEHGGTAAVDDVTISDDGPEDFAWEVAFTDDVEIYLDIATGEVLRVETD